MYAKMREATDYMNFLFFYVVVFLPSTNKTCICSCPFMPRHTFIDVGKFWSC